MPRLITLSAIALLALTGQALAHGWVNPFPVGGAFPPAAEPVGGIDAEAILVGDSVVPVGGGDVPTTGTTTGGTRSGRTTPRTTNRLRSANKSSGRVTPNFGAKKGSRAPWSREIRIPWKSGFVKPQEGYDSVIADLDRALTPRVADGGWERDARPSIVVLYDPNSRAHEKALADLNKDVRVRAAAHLFNCYRVDARTLGGAPKKLVVRAYDAKGRLASELKGGRATQVFTAMRTAWRSFGKRDLSKVVVRADALVRGLAWCDYQLGFIEKKVICPDCGHEREDVVENIDQTRVRRESVARALSALR